MEQQYSIKKLFELLSKNKIVLPDFQRDFVWKKDKQASLLASLLVKLSIGSLLMINGRKNDFLPKEIGYAVQKQIDNNDKNDCQFLLDGQQRFTSMWSFFSDIFSNKDSTDGRSFNYDGWQTVWDKIYIGLRYRWFVKITPVDDSDFFGYNNFRFSINALQKKEPSDILPHIIYKEIQKTVGHENWYHPAFFDNIKKAPENYFSDITSELSDEEKYDDVLENNCRDLLVKKAANEGLIPLYTISNDESSSSAFYIDIINRIAYMKQVEIQTNFDNLSRQNKLDEIKKEIQILFGDIKTETNLVKDSKKWRSVENFTESSFLTELIGLVAKWKTELKNYFQKEILSTKINLIELEQDQIQRAIAIFTAINEGGQKLSTFDLVVAKAAKVYKNNSLSQEIRSKIETEIPIPDSISIDPDKNNWSLSNMGCLNENHIESNFQNSFLNILSALVHTNYNESPENFSSNLVLDYFKTAKQLEMTPDQIANNFEKAMIGLQRAHAFLQFRCGIISGTDLQYRLMLLPIAFCLLNDDCWNNLSVINKLECWYWSSIFSGVYRGNQNNTACKDTKYLYDLLVLNNNCNHDNVIPLETRIKNIFLAQDYTDQQTLLLKNKGVSVPKSIHFGILQFILSKEPTDFLPNFMSPGFKLKPWLLAKAMNKEQEIEISYKVTTAKGETQNIKKTIKRVEDHHIFPLANAAQIGISTKNIRANKKDPLNSPLNRTYISNLANGAISGLSIDQYFKDLSEDILTTHLTPYFQKGYDAEELKSKNDVKDKVDLILSKRFDKLKDSMSTELNTLYKC